MVQVLESAEGFRGHITVPGGVWPLPGAADPRRHLACGVTYLYLAHYDPVSRRCIGCRWLILGMVQLLVSQGGSRPLPGAADVRRCVILRAVSHHANILTSGIC
eukprot:GHUV01017665.1.p2 GENE.GHUV01017665.1~~GHUV01017665.1.p2  ORF type:complete len:104 (-),score=9.56 GHUV01017665.1:974-1285(-)